MKREQILEQMHEGVLQDIRKVTESKGGSFYLMITKKRGKTVGEDKKVFLTRLKIFVNVYTTIIQISYSLF